MPWNIKENASECRGGYAVLKDTGELVSCHPSRSRAEAHMRALYASEADSKKEIKSILTSKDN